MQQKEFMRDDRIGAIDWLKRIPFHAAASSVGRGWAGLEAARYRASPATEYNAPAISHHWLVLFNRPPPELDVRYEGVKRHVPPPAGAIFLVPAGTPVVWRWSGFRDTLHVYLEAGLVARVAAEAFGLDSTRLTIPPQNSLDLPELRAAMAAVDAELSSGGAGESLASESLANVLAVQLLRHVLAPRKPEGTRDGVLPQARLRAVIDYVQEHLSIGPSLEQMAMVAHLSAYHFARQFKAATGLPPHQYVIARRVERAKELLQKGTELSLAEVAAHTGFSDQSQLCHHFKRVIGVTPGQFRLPARIA